MEWGAYAGTLRRKGLFRWINCEAAEVHEQHDRKRCPARARYVRALLPPIEGDAPRVALLTPDEIIEHLSDGVHDWRRHCQDIDGLVARSEYMDICLSGLVHSRHVSGLDAANFLLSLEGLGESFNALPASGGILDQPQAWVQALSVIRAARNDVQDRRIEELERNRKGAT